MGMCDHPTGFAGLERGIALRRAWVVNFVGVEGARLPFRRRDLVHTDGRGKLVRQLSERAVAFLQAIVASLLGGTLINTDAAPAHLEHHGQQVNVEPIGGARAFLIEYWVQVLK